jgi:hypothetical protein
MAYRQRTGIPAATRSILTDEPDFLRVLVERVLQAVLDAEMTAHLPAERYERSPERRGYRNGYKPRQLNTRVGTLSLQVPQDRDGSFSTQLFVRYERNEKALVLALMEMDVGGRLDIRRLAQSPPERDQLSLPERGCPLRACAARRPDRQSGRADRRGRARRRAARNPRGRGRGYRERSDL